MLVAFRADASVHIGTGHVMRCLTLAEELKRHGHECLFICRDHAGNLGSLIRAKAFDLHLLPAENPPSSESSDGEICSYADWLGVSWEEDAQQTLELLSGRDARWIVVDHYALDARWERKVGQYVDLVMAIDDLANRPHDTHILLDQNLGRFEADYDDLVPARTLRLIGPRFSLLRPEFGQLREQCLKRRNSMRCQRILISLGGVDRTNVTARILSALASTSLSFAIELDIVMGASAPFLAEVKSQAEMLPFKASVSVNVNNMAERMCMADLSIGAAGSTSWERCCLGLPSIMIILAENQQLIAEALARAGCALIVHESGILDKLGPLVSKFAGSASELEKFSSNAAAVCDGRGATRVVSTMTGRDFQ